MTVHVCMANNIIPIIIHAYSQDQRGKLASSGTDNSDDVYSTLGEVRIHAV